MESKLSYLEANNMAFASFLVLTGRGRGIVVSEENNLNKPETYRMKKSRIYFGLNKLALVIAILSVIFTIFYLIIWAAWLRTAYPSRFTDILSNLLNIIVSGVPSELPVLFTGCLFVVLRILRRSGVIVKNLFGIYSMSDIDVVITDKTGTITKNLAQVAYVFYSLKEIDVDMCVQSPDV